MIIIGFSIVKKKYASIILSNIKSIKCPKLKKIGFYMNKRPSIREMMSRENIQAFSHLSKLNKIDKKPFPWHNEAKYVNQMY